MRNEWGRRPEIIEGEYEVIDEWDADETYYRRQDRYAHINPDPPYVTYGILAINIGIWLIMSFIGTVFGLDLYYQLLYFGAKINHLIVQGQYWRLFTAMFLHIGIMHLFFNSYALYVYGSVVEKLFGRIRFVLIYTIAGLTGSLLSFLLSRNPAVGASGAIFGLMGSLLYFRRRKLDLYRKVFGPGLYIVIGINLFFGFIQPGIDNWGHIGGLIGGFLAANAVGLYRERKPSIKKAAAWFLIITCFVLGIWYGQRKYAPAMLIETGNYMLKNESGFEYRKEMRYLVGGAGEYEVWTGSAGQMRQLPE
ncbi:MAG: rhomboid family intramembrane serine protease [Clostridiales bacterium]|nr:rhomboid family intramembrane serine protease [Clostridiales bacterium]